MELYGKHSESSPCLTQSYNGVANQPQLFRTTFFFFFAVAHVLVETMFASDRADGGSLQYGLKYQLIYKVSSSAFWRQIAALFLPLLSLEYFVVTTISTDHLFSHKAQATRSFQWPLHRTRAHPVGFRSLLEKTTF